MLRRCTGALRGLHCASPCHCVHKLWASPGALPGEAWKAKRPSALGSKAEAPCPGWLPSPTEPLSSSPCPSLTEPLREVARGCCRRNGLEGDPSPPLVLVRNAELPPTVVPGGVVAAKPAKAPEKACEEGMWGGVG